MINLDIFKESLKHVYVYPWAHVYISQNKKHNSETHQQAVFWLLNAKNKMVTVMFTDSWFCKALKNVPLEEIFWKWIFRF